MKYILTLELIFINVLGLIAQSDFRNGYIINNSYDTIYGFIDYKGNKANAKQCTFRENLDSYNQIYTPDELIGYRFTNSKYYESKSFMIENEPKQLFLEYLISGIVDIYYYRDDKGEHYFLDDKSGDLHELKNEEKEIYVNNTNYLKESKEYIGVLKATFKESPSIYKRLDNAQLNHKSLITLAHDYHNEVCTDEACIIFEKKLIKRKYKYGFVLGMNDLSITQIKEFVGEYYYLNNSQYEYDFSPSLGLYYKVNMPNLNERLFFQYEGTYSRTNLKISNSYISIDSFLNYLNTISLIQNTLKNLAVIKYEFPNGKIKPVFQFGGFVNYVFKTEYNRDIEVKFLSSGETYYTDYSNNNPFSKIDFGFNSGIGLKMDFFNEREIFIDVRYQRGFGSMKNFNTNIFSINAGFQLRKLM